jgi:hypothetical protein
VWLALFDRSLLQGIQKIEYSKKRNTFSQELDTVSKISIAILTKAIYDKAIQPTAAHSGGFMDCPRNASGQKLCYVVDHPDNLSESFCATCNERFQKSRSASADAQSGARSNPQLLSALTDIIMGVLALFLAAVVNSAARSTELQLPPVEESAVPAAVSTALM